MGSSPASRRYILHCGCGNTGQYAEESYRLLYPNTPIPPSAQDATEIRRLAEALPEGSSARDYIMGIMNSEHKYAWYIAYTGDGTIENLADLLKGRKVK